MRVLVNVLSLIQYAAADVGKGRGFIFAVNKRVYMIFTSPPPLAS